VKLQNKTLKIKTDDEEKETLARRYFHITLDKLADAFEKQFLNGLPDFARYSQNEVSIYSANK